MEGIQAVIFDLDGLLIASEDLWRETDIELLKRREIDYDIKIRSRIRGLGQKEAIELYKKEFGVKGDIQTLIKERRAIFYSLAKNRLKLLSGAGKLTQELYNRGYSLAIATGGHTKKKIQEILTQFGLENYFLVLISSDEVENGKPAPDVYLASATRLGVQPLNCLVLEDAVNGVLAAKNAGMRVFGVNRDLGIRNLLKEAGAERVFKSLNEIRL
ncbi:MAG: HAD family phosphatase [Candidatus Levybacteria bacterium]|nr:HAD family phosphatase [Candidatus Levybacteria bacterium]MBI2190197.1 HAD family phosphatase [Candidatus Levybacteria bacterium]MBI3070403.1 HAD family phosphatase [Candidatus Levybacteria bacterium]MBI3092869.1 HAD family phosphatase [Candidatus Levybacteria bacterium]